MDKEVTFRITQRLAVLSQKDNGYSKQVNLVSWNDGTPKLDLREWSPENKRGMKGITLTEDEGRTLMRALVQLYGDQAAHMG